MGKPTGRGIDNSLERPARRPLGPNQPPFRSDRLPDLPLLNPEPAPNRAHLRSFRSRFRFRLECGHSCPLGARTQHRSGQECPRSEESKMRTPPPGARQDSGGAAKQPQIRVRSPWTPRHRARHTGPVMRQAITGVAERRSPDRINTIHKIRRVGGTASTARGAVATSAAPSPTARPRSILLILSGRILSCSLLPSFPLSCFS
jgi:hypothetical protein